LELRIPIHKTKIDPSYNNGRVDIAPRVMGQSDWDGKFGYVVAVQNDTAYDRLVVVWDNYAGEFFVDPNDVRWI